jgi:hypothetical protein
VVYYWNNIGVGGFMRHRETVSWITAIIMAVIIGLVIVGLVNWLLPV